MTKNSTLKGLALGAIGALVASGVSVLPANAAGLADTTYISLKPTVGTEYTVLAANGATFSLVANEASTLTTGNLKFLVSDPSGLVEPTYNTTARIGEVITSSTNVNTANTTIATSSAGVGSLGRVTFKDFSGTAHSIDAGSLVAFSAQVTLGSTESVTVSATSEFEVKSATKASGVFEIAANAAVTNVPSTVSGTANVRVLREPRDTTKNTYVVDSGVASAGSNETLELKVTGDTTRVVEVTAWKDANANNKIDDNEYVSPTRTITFVKPSEVVATVAIAPIVGDAKLTAKVSTVPVLNGQSVLNFDSDVLDVEFTRQGSAVKLVNPQGGVTWDDDAKVFKAEVSTGVDSGTPIGRVTTSPVAGGTNNASWSDMVAPVANLFLNVATVTTKSNQIIYTAPAGTAHNLTLNDKVFLTSSVAGYSVTFSIAAIPASNSFAIATTTASPEAATYSVLAIATYDSAPKYYVGRVFAGTYTAQAYIAGAKSGAKAEIAPQAAIADTVEITTVGSATLQGKVFDAVGTNTTLVKTGVLALSATAVVYDEDGDAVGAGRPVSVSFSGTGDTFKVNGKTGTHTVLTDANGAVALAVTSLSGTKNSTLTVTVNAEGGAATADIDFEWKDAAYSLVELSKTVATISGTTRTIASAGSYTFDFGVMDQWFTAGSSASYRLVVTGNGVTEGVRTLTDGKASVVVTDNGLGVDMSTTIKLQKLSSGTWTDSETYSLTTKVQKTAGITLGKAGSSLYGSEVVLSSAVAAKALVELDERLSTTVKPSYKNNAVINGKVVNSSTNVAQAGAEVVISGPTNILFESGKVSKRGSLTVVSDANGLFEYKLYSTTAQKDTVITVTSLGKSETFKVTFTGIGVGEGTALVITAPVAVAPASTLQIKAQLNDAYGNGVEATEGRVKMTYTGAGIGFGALPTKTDATGGMVYSVLLGAGDTGTITVVVSYDQNGDGDFSDDKDLNTTKTITVEQPNGPVVDAVIGSFNGRWAVRVENAKGSTIAVKAGGKWYKYTSLNDNYLFSRKSKKGAEIVVKVYIDGALFNEQTITVK